MVVGIIYDKKTKPIIDKFFTELRYEYWFNECDNYECYKSGTDTFELYSADFARKYKRSGLFFNMALYPEYLKNDEEVMDMLYRCTRNFICPQAGIIVLPYGF